MKCVFMWGQLGSFSLARLGRLRGIELSGARQAGQEHAVAPGSPGERGRHALAGLHGGPPARPAPGCAFVSAASPGTGGLGNLQVVTGAERWPLRYHGEQSTR